MDDDLRESNQFRPPPPPALISESFQAARDEVYRLGRVDSADRTAEEAEVARLWADCRGTATPPGHRYQMAQGLSADRGLDLVENARLLPLPGIAASGAAIVSLGADYWCCR